MMKNKSAIYRDFLILNHDKTHRYQGSLTRKVVRDVVSDFEIDEKRGERHRLIDFVSQVNMTITGPKSTDGNDAMAQHFAVLVVHAKSQMRQVG